MKVAALMLWSGLAMLAGPGFGETQGGPQAPHGIRIGGEYHLFCWAPGTN